LKTFRYRFGIIALLMLLCFILLSIVWLSATTAKVQYEINKIDKQISETQKDIRTLQVRIKTASNITNIEARAEELGLVYPSFDQVKYIRSEQDVVKELALALMETAYQ